MSVAALRCGRKTLWSEAFVPPSTEQIGHTPNILYVGVGASPERND